MTFFENIRNSLFGFSQQKLIERLKAAIEQGNLEEVKNCIVAGVKVDQVPKEEDTPLTLATKTGNLAIVKELLNVGADPNRALPLSLAISGDIMRNTRGSVEVVMALLTAGADPNLRQKHTHYTPIMIAAGEDNLPIVRALVNGGGSVLLEDNIGRNAIWKSLTSFEDKNRTATIKFLRECADRELANSTTNLYKATKLGATQMVEKLINSGSDLNALDEKGRTALSYAAEYGIFNLFEMLLTAGADPLLAGPRPKAKDEHWEKILENQRCAAHPAIVYAAGGLTTTDNVVCESNEPIQLEMLRKIVRPGTDLEVCNEHDRLTALMAAAGAGYFNVVKFLADHGADVGAKDKWNYDPARHARGSHNKIADYLANLSGKPSSLPEYRRLLKNLSKSANKSEFIELSQKLAQICGNEPIPWLKHKGVLMYKVSISEKDQSPKLHDPNYKNMVAEADKAGYLLILCEEEDPPALLFPTQEKYVAVLATEVCASGSSTPEEIVEWLENMEKENPFVLRQSESSLIEGEFKQPVVNAEKLAREMYQFCPDIVDQGTETIEALANELKANKNLFLWWD